MVANHLVHPKIYFWYEKNREYNYLTHGHVEKSLSRA